MNKEIRRVVLFFVTIITTTLAGAEWMFGRFIFFGEKTMTWSDFLAGFQFSVPFLLILTVHEFGHYFTAKYHKIKTTLPTYIPLWLGFIAFPSFGTMGAFIRIKEAIFSRKHYFDVGVSGPLAGFIIALGVIWYGFTHLPEPEYIFQVHPEYEQYGLDYPQYVYDDQLGVSMRFGNNLIYWFFESYVVEDPELMPHPNEIIHYPYLLAGYLALFFTALNLLPIGQLDGGHVTFGLFGPRVSRRLNELFFTVFLFYAGLGWINPRMLEDLSISGSFSYLLVIVIYLYFIYMASASMFPGNKANRWVFAAILFAIQFFVATYTSFEGYGGWLVFAFIVGRFLGVYHPPVVDNRPLDKGRQIVGWIAIVVFILSFSPRPFIIE